MKDFVVGLVNIIVQSALLSAFLCLCQWLLSFTGVCGIPSWNKFLYGGLGVAVFLLLHTIYKTIKYYHDK